MKNQNSIMQEVKETIKNARKKLRTPMAPAMLCKINKNNQNGVTRGKTNEIKSKLACILEVSEFTRLRMGESLPNHDHVAGKGNNSHGPRLYVCQATNAFVCVSSVAPFQTPNAFVCVSPNAFICVSPNAFICVSPNAFAESATQRSSLRSLTFARFARTFYNNLN